MTKTKTNPTDESGRNINPVLCTVVINEFDMQALVRIRNYFGENDKSPLEQMAYDVLNRLVKQYLGNGEMKEEREE
jgi:hypothetical protein